MLRRLKMAFAPSAVSFGIQSYWAGKYAKALNHFQKANRWWPELIPNEPLYQAYFTLTQCRLGQTKEALPQLEQSLLHLQNPAIIKEIPSTSTSVIAEIQNMLSHLRA